jgi:pimeloyl-ACP methyl ester carboxylesterase
MSHEQVSYFHQTHTHMMGSSSSSVNDSSPTGTSTEPSSWWSWWKSLKWPTFDSIGYIDQRVHSLVFQPPDTPKALIEGLKDGRTTDVFLVKTDAGLDVGVVRCIPETGIFHKCAIFSHGNGTDAYEMHDYLKWFANRFGVCVLCYDYPGYGLTVGKATEESCGQCLKAVVDYATGKLRVNKRNIRLIGQSLGTGVTVGYAVAHGWTSPILLISPYKSIPRVVLDWSMSDWATRHYRFGSMDKVASLKCPTKIIHGEQDELINIRHGKDLYAALPDQRLRPVWIPDANHNDILCKIKEDDILGFLAFAG